MLVNDEPGKISQPLKRTKQEENHTIFHHLARCSKSERQKNIKEGSDNVDRRNSAAIEISRVWRGYRCRKFVLKNPNNMSGVGASNKKPIQSSVDMNKQTASLVTQQDKRVFTRHAAAVVIQRAWRKHIDTQVFRYYRDLINFRGRGDPSMMLRCINPNEAKLLDAAAGVHVRFRLAGEKFPPNIYYKIYTHRPVVDMGANSPKDYTKAASKRKSAREVNNRFHPGAALQEKEGWYNRYENNGWRLVSDRLIHLSMDPVTWDTSRKRVDFHHVKLQRKADVEQRRRKRKIEWMKKMYKDGMLRSRENDEDTKYLVEKAARGLINTVQMQGSDAVMDWEVDELLQWTTALSFDDYIETWKECATSTVSDGPGVPVQRPTNDDGPLPVNFDPYALTRASSLGPHRGQRTELPSASTRDLPTSEVGTRN